jgi:PKD repeat protein
MSRLSLVVIAAPVLLVLAIATGVGVSFGESPQWVRQFGTSGSDKVREISADQTGSYVTGSTDGAFPGFTKQGQDNFLLKYDPDGNCLWTRQFGTEGTDCAYGVCADGDAVYVTGTVDGVYPGQTFQGGIDAFLRKYDTNGNEVWTRQFGTDLYDFAVGIAVYDEGVYVAGYTNGVFDPEQKEWDYDIFVRKYDTDGNEVWTRQFETKTPEGFTQPDFLLYDQGGSNVIYVDATGVYVAGYSNDVVVQKYDLDGNPVWTAQFGTSSTFDQPSWVCVLGTDCYVAGRTWGFFPTYSNPGGWDAFICKLDDNGLLVGDDTYQFAGGPNAETAVGMSFYPTNVVIAGWMIDGFGNQDVFVRSYELGFTSALWTQMLGTSSQDVCEGMAEYSSDIYVGGWTMGTLGGISFGGGHDGFVAKWGFNSPPTVNANGPYSVNEGDVVPVTAEGSDPEEDPLTYAWDFDDDGVFEEPGQTVSFSAADRDDGTYPIAVQVSDGQATATDQATVNVLNVAPVVGEITAPYDPVPVDAPVTASASFSDAGIKDTHTGLWDWGDGTAPEDQEGNVTEVDGSGSVTGAHTYTSAGVYTVALTVTDDDGGSGESVYQYVVVYDPNAGFVTGGGWIMSPEGAYSEDPTLAGKANFGFVSKYRRGATIPIGNTEFAFKVADLNFHSTEYQWLVIAGAKAMFKGSGEINGEGDYGFMVTAVDGEMPGGEGVDEFRIKIWDAVTEDVVYDNCIFDPVKGECEPQEIGGGSIVIHTGGGKQSLGSLHGRPTVFALDQNRPNPFLGSTMIEYSLPADRDVSLKIYDSAGRLVRTLVDEHQASGFYALEWDGSDALGVKATNGIYLMRLVAGGFSSTKKMILIR